MTYSDIDYAIISESKYFDKKWYLKNNVDVAISKIDPVEHYLTRGWLEGRNPSPIFDNNAYLEMYPDIKDAKTNPLLHYEKFGKDEGRKIQKPDIIKLNLYEKIGFKLLTLKHKFGIIDDDEYILKSGKYTNQMFRRIKKSRNCVR